MKTIWKNTCRRDLRIVCLNYFLEEDMDNANDQPYWQSLMMEVGKEDEVHFHWKRTKVVDITSNVRQMKWSWAGHINRLKDDRWTSRVTTWKPYDKKRRQRRSAKRWRDDLDKYWRYTIWQRKAQDRLTWRRHGEADTQQMMMMMMMMMTQQPVFVQNHC